MANNIRIKGFENKKLFEVAKVFVAGGFGALAAVDAKVATGIYESEMKPLYKIIGCTVFTWKTWVNLQNMGNALSITYEQAHKKAEPEKTESADVEEPYTEEVTEPEYSTDDSNASPEPQE